MRSYISYDELEELGETIVRAYINKTRRYNALCVDIEGLVTDYLGLTVVYETIVEDDLNKIAFLSNGKRPLRVVRDGKRVEVIFPKNTVVLDKVLLNEKESSRRRFTLGHEGAHSIIAKQNPMQDVGCFPTKKGENKMPKATLISPISKQGIQLIRVAAYCRVSSSSADQQNSYATQIDYYTKLAKKKKSEWNMVEIFADEGISGMKAKNRPEFQRMIRMCELHQIDLIVTKSVSRFARNVKEALEYVRNLKLLGVGVIFEKEGINTMSLGDEMLLNTFTAIAQEESKAISQNQRLSIVKRMELGVYVDSNAPYGFHLENKQLVEYPPEADIVRWIFQAYLRGMSTAEIAKDLSDRGVPTKNGKEKWKSSKISYMLSNERYIGDCCYQKTYRGTTVPFKQSKNRGEEDMYYATGTHAPIVEKDLFEKVQVLLKKRKEQFTKATTQNIYPLSSRIRCSECGSFYRRKVRSGGVKWVCARHEEDFKACNSNYYSEERRRGTHVACGEQPSGHRYS